MPIIRAMGACLLAFQAKIFHSSCFLSKNRSLRGFDEESDKAQPCVRYKRKWWEDKCLWEGSKYMKKKLYI